MSTGIVFPGGVFDADGVSLLPGKPDLNQSTIDVMPVRALVAADEPHEGEVRIGRIWLLNAGASFEMIPTAERQAARSMLRVGMSIMLLAPDAATEARVRSDLLALCDQDETPQGRFGHA